MKKRSFVLTVLAVMMAVTMLCIASPAVNAVDARTQAYRAYYDFVMDIINNQGKPTTDQGFYSDVQKEHKPSDSYFGKYYYQSDGTLRTYLDNGIAFLQLADLDGDKIEELIMVRKYLSAEKILVSLFPDTHKTIGDFVMYTYKNGKLVRYNLPQAQDFEHRGHYYWSKGTDGKIYFANTRLDDMYDDAYHAEYVYWFNGTDFEPKTNYRISFLHDWYISSDFHSAYGTYLYYINENRVSETVYQNSLKKYYSGGIHEITEPYGTVGIGSTYDTSVLRQIEAVAGTDYVARYTSPSVWSVDTVKQAISQMYVPSALQCKYDRPITRSEFCALAVQFYEKCKVGEITARMQFSDTTDINVQKLGGLGVVNGVGNNQFAPDKAITRQEAATILVRLAKAMGTELPTQIANYVDQAQIASWALAQVGQMQKSGIMGGVGNGKFAPLEPYTREQSIVTLMRVKSALAPVERLSLPASETIYRVGQTKQIVATIQPANAGVRGLVWSTANANVATVDNAGNVTAAAVGTTEITATAENGVLAVCKVRVLHETDYLDLVYETPELNCIDITVSTGSASSACRVSDDFSFQYMPSDAHNAGAINIQKVSATNTEIRIESIVTKVNTGFEFRFVPYIKYQLKDEMGNVVKEGATIGQRLAYDNQYRDYRAGTSAAETGEVAVFFIPVSGLKDEQYSLQLLEERGKEASSQQPTIQVVGLPASTTKKISFSGVGSRQVTTTINSVEPEFTYSAGNDCYYTKFRFNIKSQVYDGPTQQRYCYVIWVLKDELGEIIAKGEFDVTKYQFDQNGESSEVDGKYIGLKLDKVYTLFVTVK